MIDAGKNYDIYRLTIGNLFYIDYCEAGEASYVIQTMHDKGFHDNPVVNELFMRNLPYKVTIICRVPGAINPPKIAQAIVEASSPKHCMNHGAGQLGDTQFEGIYSYGARHLTDYKLLQMQDAAFHRGMTLEELKAEIDQVLHGYERKFKSPDIRFAEQLALNKAKDTVLSKLDDCKGIELDNSMPEPTKHRHVPYVPPIPAKEEVFDSRAFRKPAEPAPEPVKHTLQPAKPKPAKPRFARPKSDKPRKRREGKPCWFEGKLYASMCAAAKAANMSGAASVALAIKRGDKRFLAPDKEQPIIKAEPSQRGHRRGKPCWFEGKQYASLTETAKAAGMSLAGTAHAIARGDERFLPPSERHVKRQMTPGRGQYNVCKCCIEGVIYRSVKDASEKLGIPYQQVHYRIHSSHFKDWQLV